MLFAIRAAHLGARSAAIAGASAPYRSRCASRSSVRNDCSGRNAPSCRFRSMNQTSIPWREHSRNGSGDQRYLKVAGALWRGASEMDAGLAGGVGTSHGGRHGRIPSDGDRTVPTNLGTRVGLVPKLLHYSQNDSATIRPHGLVRAVRSSKSRNYPLNPRLAQWRSILRM